MPASCDLMHPHEQPQLKHEDTKGSIEKASAHMHLMIHMVMCYSQEVPKKKKQGGHVKSSKTKGTIGRAGQSSKKEANA